MLLKKICKIWKKYGIKNMEKKKGGGGNGLQFYWKFILKILSGHIKKIDFYVN